jgi:hypothetical protein
MAKKISSSALVIPIAIFVILVVVVVLAVALGSKKNGPKNRKKAAMASRATSPKQRSRAGAAPGSGAGGAGGAGGAAAGQSGMIPIDMPHPDYLTTGATANSDTPMPAEASVSAMMARAKASDGPQDTKNITTAQSNLYDGTGIGGTVFAPEQLQEMHSAKDVMRAFEGSPELRRMLDQEIEIGRRPANNSGVSRAKPTREETAEIDQIVIDMPVTQQSHQVGRSGRPSAVSPDRFANAVGPSNLANLAASRSQYDSLIKDTLVEPHDREKIAALVALIQKKVTDPAARARLLMLVKPLISAVFKDEEAAQQALQNGGTGYIGFTDRIDSRGTSGSIAARYSAGDGGDLMPLFGNYPPITTINRDRLNACGVATHQAYEFAAGRDFGGFQ